MQKNDIYYFGPINRKYLGYSCQPKLNGKQQNKLQQLLLLVIVYYVLPIAIIMLSSNFNIYSFVYHFDLFHLGWNHSDCVIISIWLKGWWNAILKNIFCLVSLSEIKSPRSDDRQFHPPFICCICCQKIIFRLWSGYQTKYILQNSISSTFQMDIMTQSEWIVMETECVMQ